MKDFLLSSKIKIIQIVIVNLFFLQITSDIISTCSNGDSLSNETCFNNLIKIDNYRAGQFGEDKDGNLFLLYSNTVDKKKRLFYGLKNNGRNYFGESDRKEIEITPASSVLEIKESRIIFVTLSDGKQYLFSTSAGNPHSTLAELYYIKENEINKFSNLTNNLLRVENSEITSSHYSLIKLPNENKYFLAFAQGNEIIIKKFNFTGSDLNGFNEIKSSKVVNNNYNPKIISCFLMEKQNILVLFYMENYTFSYYHDFSYISPANYTKLFFHANDDNLRIINTEKDKYGVDPIPGPGFFFKGIYLNNNYSAFIYSRANIESFEVVLNISKLIYESYDDYLKGYTFMNSIQIIFDEDYNINADSITNEFIKINNGRLVFITTEGNIDSKPILLSIILFDISDEDYSDVIEKKYYYNLDDYYLQKEIAAFVYNGFLSLSCTYNKGDSNVFNSILAFFGYVYGIDETIDIYPYFNDVSTFST